MKDICILAVGGTIDKVHDPISEQLIFSGKSYVPDVLRECRARNIPHQIVMLKDSLEMNDQDRAAIQKAILARPEPAIVITHGTSTMPETAEFLRDRVAGKTVVLTGAMRPFSLFQSDAGFNLGGAIIAARVLPPGVYIVMNGKIFVAGEVAKNVAEGIFVEKS